MNVIPLSYFDLVAAAGLVLALAGLSLRMALGIASDLLIAALRTTVQLLLVGLVLKALFATIHLGWLALIASVMLLVAGREVQARQAHPILGIRGFALGTGAMLVSSFTLTVFALALIVQPAPWYTPQYAVPLLGMILGNTMSALALGLDRLNESMLNRRASIEARLSLGHCWPEAIAAVRRDAARVAMLPTINAMAAAGLVSLPGMMTGQILSGTPPIEAVKYQILIMFLIAVGSGFGAFLGIAFGSRLLFDERHRLRLERLRR